jgi:DNA-directed RNA polymerase subunit RPC12/RpoP
MPNNTQPEAHAYRCRDCDNDLAREDGNAYRCTFCGALDFIYEDEGDK